MEKMHWTSLLINGGIVDWRIAQLFTTFALLFRIIKQNLMTKIEIVREIASKTGLPTKDVMVIVESLMETIKISMANGDEVFLRGFGSFIIKHRADKTARNISKNTTVIIPAHDVPAFKPAKEFMDQVKG
jgi:DNA-binding protein HU-beta